MADQASVVQRLADQPLARVAAYYVMLAALVMLLYRIAPELPGVFHIELATDGVDLGGEGGGGRLSAGRAALEALMAMMAALLLMLPVAWVYIMTRRTRGYQQSLIQTAIILPIAVACIVIMIKNSVALAFSLGGIVGAIAFRNRLEDTKDAVHVFVSVGVGVACGVQALSIAATLSVFYNVVQLLLWWTDFGRTPPPLEGPPAQQRLQELQGADNHGSDAFVSQVDTLLLKSMSPDQLQGVLKRADKRRRRYADSAELPVDPVETGKRVSRLRLMASSEALENARRKVEPILDRMTKRWLLEGAASEDGKTVAHYEVHLKKKHPASQLLTEVKNAVGSEVETVELV